MVNFYFIVASVAERERLLERLLDSISSKFNAVPYKIVVVKQNHNTMQSNLEFIDEQTTIININEYGASNARNIGLNFIEKYYDLSEKDIICFPDDDSFYGIEVADLIKKRFDEGYNFVFGDVKNEENTYRLGSKVFLGNYIKFSYIYVNCPSFYINYSILNNLRFDTSFGPGSKFYAAEETEFIYRLIKLNKINCCYDKDIVIFHPHEIPSNEKIFKYGYAQGKLFKKILTNLHIIQTISYFIMLIRPFVGMLRFRADNRNLYALRIKGIIFGFLNR